MTGGELQTADDGQGARGGAMRRRAQSEPPVCADERFLQMWGALRRVWTPAAVYDARAQVLLDRGACLQRVFHSIIQMLPVTSPR